MFPSWPSDSVLGHNGLTRGMGTVSRSSAGVSRRPESPVSQFPGTQSLSHLHRRFSLGNVFKFVFQLGSELNNQSYFLLLFLSISVHDGFLGASPLLPHFQVCVLTGCPVPLVIFSDLQCLWQQLPWDSWSWLVTLPLFPLACLAGKEREMWTTNGMEVPVFIKCLINSCSPWWWVAVLPVRPAVCGGKHVPEGRRAAFTLFFFLQFLLWHNGSHVCPSGRARGFLVTQVPCPSQKVPGQCSGHQLPGQALGCDGQEATAAAPPQRWEVKIPGQAHGMHAGQVTAPRQRMEPSTLQLQRFCCNFHANPERITIDWIMFRHFSIYNKPCWQ